MVLQEHQSSTDLELRRWECLCLYKQYQPIPHLRKCWYIQCKPHGRECQRLQLTTQNQLYHGDWCRCFKRDQCRNIPSRQRELVSRQHKDRSSQQDVPLWIGRGCCGSRRLE